MDVVRPVARQVTRRHHFAASLTAALILTTAVVAVILNQGSSRSDELLSPLEVGQYAVRAERESEDYDEKATRDLG